MQKKCHGCGIISEIENKPFAACPECGLPYGAKPAATAAALVLTPPSTRERVRQRDVRTDLPIAPRQWFSPKLLTAGFWLLAFLLLAPALLNFFLIGVNAISTGAFVVSLALVLVARITVEVALAIFAIAQSADDASRSLRILIRTTVETIPPNSTDGTDSQT